MNKRRLMRCGVQRLAGAAVLLGLFASTVRLKAGEAISELPVRDVSLRHEVQHGIDRGLAWLRSNQHTNGWWSTPDHPALTALSLAAFLGEPTQRYRTNPPPALARGFSFLLDSQRPDGGIYRTSLANYNTALGVVALALADNPADAERLRRARAFLIGLQTDQGEPGKPDTVFDGGVGYGDKYPHSDLNNTLMALEAIRATDHLVRDQVPGQTRELNWAAALQFIQNCQNLPSHNQQPWVSHDPRDRGGFVYFPGHSMAGGQTNAATGRVALRSYGSISYAGLLSYIYAQVRRDDQRVVAVMDWLRAHYTLEENPGLGPQGLFYYLHLMTKALHAAGVDKLELEDGRKIDWRRQVALRLLDLQQRDGSWCNTSNRWWEKDPCLVTAYAVLALEIIWRGL
jgi:squalene-hopene/tetraprenyl-beta-curcumene cyclase